MSTSTTPSMALAMIGISADHATQGPAAVGHCRINGAATGHQGDLIDAVGTADGAGSTELDFHRRRDAIETNYQLAVSCTASIVSPAAAKGSPSAAPACQSRLRDPCCARAWLKLNRTTPDQPDQLQQPRQQGNALQSPDQPAVHPQEHHHARSAPPGRSRGCAGCSHSSCSCATGEPVLDLRHQQMPFATAPRIPSRRHRQVAASGDRCPVPVW